MSFLWKAIGLSNSIPGFPYTPRTGADADSTVFASPTLTWTMRPGVSDEDGRMTTIFSISLANADNGVKELARNAMKRSKSLLLPGLLRCYGAVEHQETVYIATEPCEPLSHVLPQSMDVQSDDNNDGEESFLESVALGLKTVGTGLVALHRNNFVHGNASLDSVYVIRGGAWRLFGLELLSVFNEPHSIYQRYATLLPEGKRPPETLQTNYESSVHISTIDSWGLACLIYEVLGGQKNRSAGTITFGANEMRACRSLPRTLQSGFIGLCAANPKMRYDVERFLKSSEFIVGSEFVQCMQTLEELSLKDAVEKEKFFEHLAGVVDTFPRRACSCLILPKLHVSFKFGLIPSVIDPILKIASHITAPEDYAADVAPIIVSLFVSPDRMIRYQLLQRAAEYAPLLPANILNEQVWPLFVSGFSNPIPTVREYSARALVPFSKNLSEKILIKEVPRYISQLQQDPEGAIRTNATVSLCLIADKLPADARSQILVHAFGRMLKDPFLPSRIGALRSFRTCMQSFTPQHIAELMIPGLGPLAVDTSAEVRQEAIIVMREAIVLLEENDKHETAKASASTSSSPSSVAAAAAAPMSKETTKISDDEKKAGPTSSFLWGWRRNINSSTSATTATTTTTTTTNNNNNNNINTLPGNGKTEIPVSLSSSLSSVATAAILKSGRGNSNNHNTHSHGHNNDTAEKYCASTTPVTATPVAMSGFSDDEEWGANKDEVLFRAHAPETSGGVDKSSSRHVDLSAMKELSATTTTAGNRAMKLRKKGLGAARLS